MFKLILIELVYFGYYFYFLFSLKWSYFKRNFIKKLKFVLFYYIFKSKKFLRIKFNLMNGNIVY